MVTTDATIEKSVWLREKLKFDLRGEFYNILNHANWQTIGTNVSSGTTFGQVTAFGSPRLIQMAMKLYF